MKKRQDRGCRIRPFNGLLCCTCCTLEQWAANAEPITVLIHNFSGSKVGEIMCKVLRIYSKKLSLTPTISGSTETNMELVQSAVAVTMIGKQTKTAANRRI